MMWMNRFARVFSEIYEGNVYLRPFHRQLCNECEGSIYSIGWFLYGTYEYQVKVLYKVYDCDGNGIIEPHELSLMVTLYL